MDMVKGLKEAFDEMLKESEWMDDATKLLAKEKVKLVNELCVVVNIANH